MHSPPGNSPYFSSKRAMRKFCFAQGKNVTFSILTGSAASIAQLCSSNVNVALSMAVDQLFPLRPTGSACSMRQTPSRSALSYLRMSLKSRCALTMSANLRPLPAMDSSPVKSSDIRPVGCSYVSGLAHRLVNCFGRTSTSASRSISPLASM